MLYAHYEGYCLFALTLYLEQLEARGIPRRDCKNELIRFSLQHHLSQFRKDTSDAKCMDFFTHGLSALLAATLDFPRDSKTKDFEIRGRSNLWPDKLSETLDDFCLHREIVDPKDTRLWILVRRRNDIAHGRNEPVNTLAEYLPYEEHVFDVMHELAVRILDSITKREYMANNARDAQTKRMARRVWEERGCPVGTEFEDWIEAERRLAEGQTA